MDVTAPSGHFPVLRFEEENRLFIASSDVSVNVEVEDENTGEYVSILDSENENNQIFSANNLGPGSVKKYKLQITNNTEAEINMSVILSDITTSIEEFYDHIYIGIYYANGFDFPYEPPEINEFKLSEELSINKDGSASRNLIDYFKVPGDFKTVEIGFYVRIGIEGTQSDLTNEEYANQNYLQNQSFTIGTISFVII